MINPALELKNVNSKLGDLRRRVGALEKKPTVLKQINGASIAPSSIDAVAIVSGTITSTQIAANSITAGSIGAGVIQSWHIQSNTITANEIQAGSITASAIAAGAISAQHITASAIKAQHIEVASVNANHIQANSINANHIQANSITATNIQANTITATEIATGALQALVTNTANLSVTNTFLLGGAGQIVTSVGNQRTTFSAAGVKSYDVNTPSAPTFDLSSSTGILTARMVIQTGTQMPLGFMGGNNLFSNSSAERPDGTTPGMYGYSSNGSVTLTANQADGIAWHGLKSFKLVNGGGSSHSTGFSTDPTRGIRANQSYTYSLYIYPVNNTRTFHLYAHARDTSNVGTGQDWASVAQTAPANQWTRITLTFKPTATNTDRVALYMWSGHVAPAGETWYVDGIQLETGEVATAYHPRDDEILPGSVTVNELAANSVSATQIQTDAITSVKVQAGAITADKMTLTVSGNNLLVNAGFGIGGFGISPSGWNNYGSLSWTTQNGANTVAWPGYLHVAADASTGGPWNNARGITQKVNVPAIGGNKFSAQALVYQDAGVRVARIHIDWVNSGNGITGTSVRRFNISPNTWTYIDTDMADMDGNKGAFTRPSTDTVAAHVYFWVENQQSTNSYWARPKLESGDRCSGWSQYISPTVIDGSSITAATITGGTITGSTFQSSSSSSAARIVMDSSGYYVYEASNSNAVVKLNPTNGLLFTANDANLSYATRRIAWANSSDQVFLRMGGHQAGGGQGMYTMQSGSAGMGTIHSTFSLGQGFMLSSSGNAGQGYSDGLSHSLYNFDDRRMWFQRASVVVTDGSAPLAPANYNVGWSYALFHSDYSDKRQKKNITNWTHDPKKVKAVTKGGKDSRLQRIQAMKPKLFNRISDEPDAPPQLGFLAQDLLEAVPEAVQVMTPEPDKPNTPAMAVTPMSLIAALTEAVKALDERLDALEDAKT